MNHNRYKSFLLSILCCLTGCHSRSQQPAGTAAKPIIHYNVVIVPDLSNRLQRSTNLPDIDIIRSLAVHIYPEIVNFKRVMNQRDRFQVILTSTQLGALHQADFSKMHIDLGRFRNQRERIDYLMSRSKGRTLQSDTVSFVSELRRIEAQASLKTDGADVWSFFNTGLGKSLVAMPGEPFRSGRQYLQDRYRNVLILLTDGYIEAGISGAQGCEGRQCRYLSSALIGKFRESYRSRPDKRENLAGFFHRNGYGITIAANPYLRDFEVLVLEVDDRSLTATGNATKEPSDYQIIRLFWEDWMRRSGVRHFEMYPRAHSAQEALENMRSFMGLR